MVAGLAGIALTGVRQVDAFTLAVLGSYAVGAAVLRLARHRWSGG
ncbi:hypothetical protein [Nocardiopsis sp. CNR-923]|nr:hypothetical protein [Nocardiopsis sp. CNR-923]